MAAPPYSLLALSLHGAVLLKTDMKTEPGHSGAPEGGPLADAATHLPPVCSHWLQAPKTAPRLIDQEHNKEAAKAAGAERVCLLYVCADQGEEQNKTKIIFTKPL